MSRNPRQGYARERILRTASQLFYSVGIRAVGIDRIIAESGVAKATFYKYFPTKDALVLAYLDRIDAQWRRKLERAAASAGESPADQLAGLFDAVVTTARRSDFRGCAFVNAAAETAPGGAIHRRTVEHKKTVRDWISDLALRAGASDPVGLATALALLLDGALAVHALEGPGDASEIAREAAALLVATVIVAPTSGGSRVAD